MAGKYFELFLPLSDDLDNSSIVNSKVGELGTLMGIRQVTQKPVESPREKSPIPGIATIGALGSNDIVPFKCLGQKPRHLFRPILQITIHDDNPLASYPRQSRLNRRMLSEIPGKANAYDRVIVLCETLDRPPGMFWTSIVYQDQFVRTPPYRRRHF